MLLPFNFGDSTSSRWVKGLQLSALAVSQHWTCLLLVALCGICCYHAWAFLCFCHRLWYLSFYSWMLYNLKGNGCSVQDPWRCLHGCLPHSVWLWQLESWICRGSMIESCLRQILLSIFLCLKALSLAKLLLGWLKALHERHTCVYIKMQQKMLGVFFFFGGSCSHIISRAVVDLIRWMMSSLS